MCIYLINLLNYQTSSFAFLTLLMFCDISVVLYFDPTAFFCFSEILKPFKAKFENKNIQRFKYSYVGNIEANITFI